MKPAPSVWRFLCRADEQSVHHQCEDPQQISEGRVINASSIACTSIPFLRREGFACRYKVLAAAWPTRASPICCVSYPPGYRVLSSTKADRCELPLTQTDIGDAMGLSTVHNPAKVPAGRWSAPGRPKSLTIRFRSECRSGLEQGPLFSLQQIVGRTEALAIPDLISDSAQQPNRISGQL
jgi:hypothetical protein